MPNLPLLQSVVASVALVGALVIGGQAVAADDDDALQAFKRKHDKVVAMVKHRAKPEQLQAEVDALLDYKWIAEAALGGVVHNERRYDRRCEPRCDEFETLLTRLIRENYLKRIRSDKKHQVEYVGEERRPRATKVTTRVKLVKNGRTQTIEIAYIMHKVEGGRWQVRDIITDGVSLARNYKYEFNKILREKGIDELIARLENKLAEVAKKD